MQEVAVTLSGLADGGLEERFQRELMKVNANIKDPNTKPDAKRTITIKIELKPESADRQVNVVRTTVSSTLATDEAVVSFATLRKTEDGWIAFESRYEDGDPPDADPRQLRIAK
jgi:hypothetical protein